MTDREKIGAVMKALEAIIEIKKQQVGGELLDTWVSFFERFKATVESNFLSRRENAKFGEIQFARVLKQLENFSRNKKEDDVAAQFYAIASQIMSFVHPASQIKVEFDPFKNM